MRCISYPSACWRAISATGLLYHQVIPFFATYKASLLYILKRPGNGIVWQGRILCVYSLSGCENVDQTRTKTNSSQINGFCERAHRTIKDAFDDIACRKKVYQSVEAWQIHADAPRVTDTEPQPHSAKPCSGKRLCRPSVRQCTNLTPNHQLARPLRQTKPYSAQIALRRQQNQIGLFYGLVSCIVI